MLQRSRIRLTILFSAWLAVGVLACERSTPGSARSGAPKSNAASETSGGHDIGALRRFEQERRERTDFLTQPPSNEQLGSDPYKLVALPSGYAGLLRGRSRLVQLDATGVEQGALLTPPSPTALSLAPGDQLYVAGELASQLAVYSGTDDQLEFAYSVVLPDVVGIRDVLAVGPQHAYIVEEVDGRLLDVRWSDTPPPDEDSIVAQVEVIDRLAGPLSLRRTPHWLLVNALLGHQVKAYPLAADGSVDASKAIAFRHDGPLWGFDALEIDGQLWAVAGGVEDHPLDRSIGSFGNIDSFLFVYRAERPAAKTTQPEASGPLRWQRSLSINLSQLGVVTPKVVLAKLEDQRLLVHVAGYATPDLLTLELPLASSPKLNLGQAGEPPEARWRERSRVTLAPGSAAATLGADGALLVANPLGDAWLQLQPGWKRASQPRWVLAGERERVSAAIGASRWPGPAERSESWRLGEILFFTTLMAPHNSAEGALSRFTCETCHFEGYVDGRTHHTGRKDVHATTKPLLGLFNNRPHFSRALDKDLSQVAHAEFRVAGKNSGHDPWFSVHALDYPWLKPLGVQARRLSPLELRQALMDFLMRFSHRENPRTHLRIQWSEDEAAGARLFEQRCEGCHRAVSSADDPASRVPFEQWQQLTLASNAPLVWGLAEYRQTGVTPYVHPEGARIPSLRRLYKKRPYFTNGSAKSLMQVLSDARWSEQKFTHAGSRQDAGQLSATQRRQLLAFLKLL